MHATGWHGHRPATNWDQGVIAIAVESISQRADLAFLERAEIDSKQLLKCLKDLKELPPLAKAADQIDLGERLSFLDGALSSSRAVIKDFEGLSTEERRSKERIF